MFVNGAEVSATWAYGGGTGGVAPQTTVAILQLGAISRGTAELWNGLIDEVRIYNRALTPLEIQHNYLATKWRYQ